MNLKLPAIDDKAKNKPLSYDPRHNKFVYYDEVLNGDYQIYPLEKLSHQQLVNLSIQRHQAEADYSIGILDKNIYKSTEIINEIKDQTDMGKQFFEMDINYLKFYLSQFPDDAFIND